MYIPIETPKIERIDTPEGRRYRTPEGNLYPSVTTVFSILENKHIEEWKARVGEEEARKIARRAAHRGTWIHEQCEHLLLGGKEFVKPGDTISSMLYFDQWKKFRPLVQRIGDVYALERPLYSNKLKTAGTVDCIGIWDGKVSIIDFKTSSRIKSHEDIDSYWMQCSAYSYMWWELTGQVITQIVILMSVEDENPLTFVDNSKSWIKKFIELRKNYEAIHGI